MKRNVGESKREYRQVSPTAFPGICRSFLPDVAVIIKKSDQSLDKMVESISYLQPPQ